jgi:dTDP-4-dehydrorhamnose 3,5-epimerase
MGRPLHRAGTATGGHQVKFTQAGIPGAWIIERVAAHDERGSFTSTWESDLFGNRGLMPSIDQASTAHNLQSRTLRGMHFQASPFEQVKLVSCSAGAIYDVTIDLRPHSPTFKHWFGIELRAETGLCLYIPAGCAHGYLTLHENSIVNYLISGKYSPNHALGVRWNDPAFGVRWPAMPSVIAPRDAQYPDFPG